MNRENKTYNFFIFLALIFWNPFTFYILHRDSAFISIKIIGALYFIPFILGIICILRINKLFNRTKNLVLSLSFLGIIFGIIISLNYLFDNYNYQEKGLIFPKNYRVTSKTKEYNYRIITNSLGIRDKEIYIDKGDKFRILCFGDSWTMGFGVDVEDSWPRKLQDYFLKHDLDKVEVINCGKGGQYTSTYLHYMKKVVPILKPDLVLVGVLQLDDLSQLYENFKPNNNNLNIYSRITNDITSYIKYSTKNILQKIKKENNLIDLKKIYLEKVNKKVRDFSYLQKKQYDLLADSIKFMFETGNLNPGLLQYYTTLTYRRVVFNNPSHKATKIAIELMNDDFQKMKTLCNKNETKLAFINLPSAEFTGHKVLRTPNDELDYFFMNNNKIDSIYRSIANINQIPYFELTDHFINLEPKDKYFFKYDGHPTKKGYDEIAKYLGFRLIKNEIFN